MLDSNISVSFNCFTGDAEVVWSSLSGWVGAFSVIRSLVDSSEVWATLFSHFKASRHFAASISAAAGELGIDTTVPAENANHSA